MSRRRIAPEDPRVRRAIDSLKSQIRTRYPNADFAVGLGDDPAGVYLDAIVDIDDLDEVLNEELLDQLYELQVDQALPIYVIPNWPIERLASELPNSGVR